MAHQRAKSGANVQHYETESEISNFLPILEALQKEEKGTTLTAKGLAQLTADLITFMENTFGKNGTRRDLTKFPISVFQDYSVGGSLFLILSACLDFKEQQGWRRFDFSTPSKVQINTSLFQFIESALLKSQHLRRPKIYISPLVEDQEKYKKIVRGHNGILVGSDSNATHIILPEAPANPDENPDIDYLRTLSKRGKFVLVHWWYYPDSYDTWLPATEVEGEPPEEEQHQGPWKVHARWLDDLEVYNEWMNEIDYEVDEETESLLKKTRTRTKKRKMDAPAVKDKGKKRKVETSITIKGPKKEESSTEESMEEEQKVGIKRSNEGPIEESKEKTTKKRKVEQSEVVQESDKLSTATPGESQGVSPDVTTAPTTTQSTSAPVSQGETAAAPTPQPEEVTSTGPDKAPQPEPTQPSQSSSDTSKTQTRAPTLISVPIKHVPITTVSSSPTYPYSTVPTVPATVPTVPATTTPKYSTTQVIGQGTASAPSTQYGLQSTGLSSPSIQNQIQISSASTPSSIGTLVPPRTVQQPTYYSSPASASSVTQTSSYISNNWTAPTSSLPSYSTQSTRTAISSQYPASVNPSGVASYSHSGYNLSNLSGAQSTYSTGSVPPYTRVDTTALNNSKRDPRVNISSITNISQYPTSQYPSTTAYSTNALPSGPTLGGTVSSSLPVISPAASWFKREKIHEIEKLAFPSFFSGESESVSKSPELYKEYRDFMMDTYQCKPENYLTVTACRRNLAGDACTILRVHAFLEYWGLINFQVPNKSVILKYTYTPPPIPAVDLKEEKVGETSTENAGNEDVSESGKETASVSETSGGVTKKDSGEEKESTESVSCENASGTNKEDSGEEKDTMDVDAGEQEPATSATDKTDSMDIEKSEADESTKGNEEKGKEIDLEEKEATDKKGEGIEEKTDKKEGVDLQEKEMKDKETNRKGKGIDKDDGEKDGTVKKKEVIDVSDVPLAMKHYKPASQVPPVSKCKLSLYPDVFIPGTNVKVPSVSHPQVPKYTCSACGDDCSLLRYKSDMKRNYHLCAECYTKGLYPSNMSSINFVRESNFIDAKECKWTDKETLLLLEALEMYGESWKQVADHVQTKTEDQCVLHFLRLPIEDPYLETDLEEISLKPVPTTLEEKVADLKNPSFAKELGAPYPFSESSNPVMSLIAFLASSVDVNVAVEAANAAYDVILNNAPKKNEVKEEKKAETGNKEEEQRESNDDDMDVWSVVDTKGVLGGDDDTDSQQKRKQDDSIDTTSLQAAAAAALGAATAKAKLLAQADEVKIQKLVNELIATQLKKLEAKLLQFNQLEELLEKERLKLEYERQKFFAEKIAFAKRQMTMDTSSYGGAKPNILPYTASTASIFSYSMSSSQSPYSSSSSPAPSSYSSSYSSSSPSYSSYPTSSSYPYSSSLPSVSTPEKRFQVTKNSSSKLLSTSSDSSTTYTSLFGLGGSSTTSSATSSGIPSSTSSVPSTVSASPSMPSASSAASSVSSSAVSSSLSSPSYLSQPSRPVTAPLGSTLSQATAANNTNTNTNINPINTNPINTNPINTNPINTNSSNNNSIDSNTTIKLNPG